VVVWEKKKTKSSDGHRWMTKSTVKKSGVLGAQHTRALPRQLLLFITNPFCSSVNSDIACLLNFNHVHI